MAVGSHAAIGLASTGSCWQGLTPRSHSGGEWQDLESIYQELSDTSPTTWSYTWSGATGTSLSFGRNRSLDKEPTLPPSIVSSWRVKTPRSVARKRTVADNAVKSLLSRKHSGQKLPPPVGRSVTAPVGRGRLQFQQELRPPAAAPCEPITSRSRQLANILAEVKKNSVKGTPDASPVSTTNGRSPLARSRSTVMEDTNTIAEESRDAQSRGRSKDDPSATGSATTSNAGDDSGDACDGAASITANAEPTSQRALVRWLTRQQMSDPCEGRKQSRFTPLRTPLRDRLQRLEERGNSRLVYLRQQRAQELQQRRFRALPAEEAAKFRRVFRLFDRDHSGLLDQDEALACLKELGLYGMNTREKHDIVQICHEAARVYSDANGGEDEDTMEVCQISTLQRGFFISLVELAVNIVPRVRKHLIQLRADEMLQYWLAQDTGKKGYISREQCNEIARSMGIDPRLLWRNPQPPHAGQESQIDFEQLQEILTDGRERSDRAIRERERQVQNQTGVKEGLFQEFRDDLVGLYDTFTRFDADQSGTLGINELALMLRETGLENRSSASRDLEQRFVQRRSGSKGEPVELDFPRFLNLMRELRAEQKTKFYSEERTVFDKFVKGRDLSIHELALALSELGLAPTRRREQDEIVCLIRTVDADGSGYIDFDEFQDFTQRTRERLFSLRHDQEVENANRIGYSEAQMNDMRCIFERLDADSSGMLNPLEMKSALAMLRKSQVPAESLDKYLADTVAKKGDDLFSFQDFLRFVRGVSSLEAGRVEEDHHRLPSSIHDVDLKVLRRALCHMGLAHAYVTSLNREATISLFCECLQISPAANLREALEAKTIEGLYLAAKARQENLPT